MAELAERCQVRENILYRLWPDKKAIFLAVLDYLFQKRMDKWTNEIDKVASSESSIIRLITYVQFLRRNNLETANFDGGMMC